MMMQHQSAVKTINPEIIMWAVTCWPRSARFDPKVALQRHWAT